MFTGHHYQKKDVNEDIQGILSSIACLVIHLRKYIGWLNKSAVFVLN